MKSKLYIKDWLLFKPYNEQSKTDFYYLQLSNKVRKVFEDDKMGYMLLMYLEKEELNELACFLTSYFEDIISGTNIWNSFVRVHKRHYNKSLPFFDLEDYMEEEINVQDVSFLIWYYINAVKEGIFISPVNSFFQTLAESVMDVLDEAWEFAPENEHLKEIYTLDESITDYYEVRAFIDRVIYGSYLFMDVSIMLMIEERELIAEEKGEPDVLLALLNRNRDEILHTARTSLLALSGKEWAAEILGENHPRTADLKEMSRRIEGYFLYKGQDENVVFLEHIASAKKFDLTKKSFHHSSELKESDSILYIGLVRWRDEWWFSGVEFQSPFNADLILDEKNNMKSRSMVNFLDHIGTEIDDILEIHHRVFLKYNNGSQIAFMPSRKINSFIKGFADAVTRELGVSEDEVRKSEERSRKEGLEPGQFNADFDAHTPEAGLVFFNPKSGCEVAFDINSAFPLPNNPYFDISKSKEDTFNLLMQDAVSPELVHYCIDHCKDDLQVFQSSEGMVYLEDLDFLLRYWKRENYKPTPSISFVGGEV